MQLPPVIKSHEMIETQDLISILNPPQPRQWNLELNVELFNATPMLIFLQKYLSNFRRGVLLSMPAVIPFLKAVDPFISAVMQSTS